MWVLRKGTQSGMKNGLMGGGAAAKAPSGAPITDEVVDQLAKLPGVITAYPELTTPVTVEANGLITSTAVDGVPVAALTASYQDAMIAGSLWEDESAVDVCVLPSVACSDLGFATPQDAIGARIAVARYQSVFRYRPVTIKAPNPDDPSGPPLEETQFQRPDGLEVHKLDVIGVYDTKQLGYVGRFLLVPEGTGRGLYGRFLPGWASTAAVRRAIVKVGDHRQLDSVREAIERLGFETQTVFDVLNVLKIVFAVFQLLLSFFGGSAWWSPSSGS